MNKCDYSNSMSTEVCKPAVDPWFFPGHARSGCLFQKVKVVSWCCNETKRKNITVRDHADLYLSGPFYDVNVTYNHTWL